MVNILPLSPRFPFGQWKYDCHLEFRYHHVWHISLQVLTTTFVLISIRLRLLWARFVCDFVRIIWLRLIGMGMSGEKRWLLTGSFFSFFVTFCHLWYSNKGICTQLGYVIGVWDHAVVHQRTISLSLLTMNECFQWVYLRYLHRKNKQISVIPWTFL